MRPDGRRLGEAAAQWAVTHRVRADGWNLRYRQAGEGPTLVLVHGLGCSADYWVKNGPWLAAAGYRVLAPDLPGFGRTEGPGWLSIAQQAYAVSLFSDVLGLGLSTWAMPCVPIAGTQSGVYVVPAVGSGVWVEFEGGNTDYPIWTGGFWGSAADVPALALAPAIPGSPNIVLQSMAQNSISISDVPGTGGIMLKSTTGAMILINDLGITISNGKGATIMMTGPTVTINNGALVIT